MGGFCHSNKREGGFHSAKGLFIFGAAFFPLAVYSLSGVSFSTSLRCRPLARLSLPLSSSADSFSNVSRFKVLFLSLGKSIRVPDSLSNFSLLSESSIMPLFSGCFVIDHMSMVSSSLSYILLRSIRQLFFEA